MYGPVLKTLMSLRKENMERIVYVRDQIGKWIKGVVPGSPCHASAMMHCVV